MKKIIIILALLITNSINAQTTLGSEFTYQGELKDSNGNPYDDTFDFNFRLFDGTNSGNQIGTDVLVEDVDVIEGIFTTQIDFGNSSFIGDKLWMEINIRIGSSTGGFQQLLPRQQITATPYATHASFVGADAVTSIEILDDSINATDIASNAVGTSEIIAAQVQRRISSSCGNQEFIRSINEDGTVDCYTDSGGLSSVTSTDIVDGTIATVDIADNSITASKISFGAVGSNEISAFSVSNIKLASNSVTSSKISANAVASSEIANNAVGNSEIANNAVTSNKIADNSITTAKLGDQSVGTAEIKDEAITSSTIADNAINKTHISANAVGTSEIITTEIQRRVMFSCNAGYYLHGINEDGTVQCSRLPLGYAFLLSDFAQFGEISIAIGNDGMPVLAVYFFNYLRVIKCTTIDCSQFNQSVEVDNVSVGVYPSITIGADGNPIISYHDNANDSLKIVKCTTANCSSFNTPITLDATGNVGRYSSIAISIDNNPIISYYNGTNNDLQVIKCTAQDCSSSNAPVVLDSINSVGTHTSIAIGADNDPVISYYYQSGGNLKLVKCSTISCSSFSTPRTLDSTGIVGSQSSLVIGSDGNPVISYSDSTNGDLKLVKCLNQSCGSTSILTLDAIGNVGKNSAIAIGLDNYPIISYQDSTDEVLKLIKCTSEDCSTRNNPLIIDSLGNSSETSLVIGVDGNPIIGYYDETVFDLKIYSCADSSCRK